MDIHLGIEAIVAIVLGVVAIVLLTEIRNVWIEHIDVRGKER